MLIGDGPDRSRAEWLAVQKGIHDDVLFLGKQDQIHEKLGIADIMLVPSELESFGLAALEAMACEVVPISTGWAEYLRSSSTELRGYLADVGDVDAMAKYAIELLNDESRLRAMGKVCREKAESNLVPQRSWPTMRISIAACWSVPHRVHRESTLHSPRLAW